MSYVGMDTKMESDGRNIYTCFHCGFTLCTKCMELHFGTHSTRRLDPNVISNSSVKIGDEVLKLPPSYAESTQPPSYELCAVSEKRSMWERLRDFRGHPRLICQNSVTV